MNCKQCEALYFNGILHHEKGCPLNIEEEITTKPFILFEAKYHPNKQKTK